MASNHTSHVDARGVVFIHSCPRALCSHVEWALGSLLGIAVHLDWLDQPVTSSTMRAELSWVGRPGLASEITSSLRGYPNVRFEVTEEPSVGHDGQRFMSTPTLGVWRSAMGVYGETLISEERLRSAVTQAAVDGKPAAESVDVVLGGPWDRELEPFRYAGEGVPVRWLHQVG